MSKMNFRIHKIKIIILIMIYAIEILITKNLPFLKFKLQNHLMYLLICI